MLSAPFELAVLFTFALIRPTFGDWPIYQGPSQQPQCCPERPGTPGPGSGVESHEVLNSTGAIWHYQAYKSSPLNPPELDITANGMPLAPGYLFFSPSDFTEERATQDPAAMIMTDQGQLVWEGPLANATNMRMQTFEGKPIITYWSGLSTAGGNIGHGYGNVTFLDGSYNEILTVCPALNLTTPDNVFYPCENDLHESYVTERDTILITAYNATPLDLSPVGGPKNGWGFDSGFFEVEPRTGEILFSWFPQAHIPVNLTRQPRQGTGMNQSIPFDWFHINSVDLLGDNYLINSRHTFGTWLIGPDGNIIWHIDGDTGGDFGPLPDDGHFRWQHDSRPHNITASSIILSWFNNYNTMSDNGTNATNGLALHLTLPPDPSTPPTVIEHLEIASEPIFADSQGSYSYPGDLPADSPNQFMDYGQIPIMREYGPAVDGSHLRWEARFGVNSLVQSYRGFKYDWVGTPTTSPSLVVLRVGGDGTQACVTGYVSWNGATEVVGWDVYEGPSGASLQKVGQVGYKGFETAFNVAEVAQCVQVVPLIKDGSEGTRSEVVCNT